MTQHELGIRAGFWLFMFANLAAGLACWDWLDIDHVQMRAKPTQVIVTHISLITPGVWL